VWRALTTPVEFAAWFGVHIDEGRFEPGTQVRMTSSHPSCAGEVFSVWIDRVEPEQLFSWRWHPGMVRPEVDYDREPKTTVTFLLEESDGQTTVTVGESGFDEISLTRRASVFGENETGWAEQLENLKRYAG
jgi:uncharacterized protein YndB with AHSA1/START domain